MIYCETKMLQGDAANKQFYSMYDIYILNIKNN